MMPLSLPSFDRRAFLLGGSAALVLAACGSDDGDTDSASSDTSAGPVGDFALLAYFDPTPVFSRAGIEQRLTWGLGTAAGAPVEDLPPELTFEVRFDGAPGATSPIREVVGEPIVSTLHDEGLPRGYYPMRFTPDREGTWSVKADVDGAEVTASFQVGPEGGPGVIEIGQAMPPVTTATVADPMGVDPLCTRAEQCPFHEVPVADAVGAGPMVLSVSTPLYCQTAVCGPVLDLLVDASAAYPDLTFVHVEPYLAPEPGNPIVGGTVPAMDELGLSYEPALFFVAADGTIVDRLDNIYDTAELTAALDALNAG
jgi:hypothetical protein